MPRRKAGPKLGVHISKFPRCTVKTTHELQNYILNLSAQNLNFLDWLTLSNKENEFFPGVELERKQGEVLHLLKDHCFSSVLLARRVRDLNMHKTIAQLMCYLSKQKPAFFHKPDVSLEDRVDPEEPEEEVSERSVSESSERVQTFELAPQEGWVL